MSSKRKPKSKLVSVVTPVYNEIDNISEFRTRVEAAFEGLSVEYELIFAVDPSTDGTEQLIEEMIFNDSRLKMLRFSRRFGQSAASLAGIDFASGDSVIVIDCDLQDPPEVIPKLVEKWLEGSPIVLARRRNRVGEPLSKVAVASAGYKFLNKFAHVPIPPNTGDFRIIDRKVIVELQKFSEANTFLRGLVSLVGFETDVVEFDRPERFAGQTKYNKWIGSLRYGFNGIVGFSTALLSISTITGISAAFLAIFLGISYAFAKLFGIDFPMGNPTIVVSILFMGGLILITNGILGMYLARVYEEVKRRPRYIVEKTIGLFRS